MSAIKRKDAPAAATEDSMRLESDESFDEIEADLALQQAPKRAKFSETAEEEQKRGDTAALAADKAIVDGRLVPHTSVAMVTQLTAAQRKAMIAQLLAVDAEEDDDDDLESGVKRPTTEEFMKAFNKDTKAKVLAMAKGGEVNDCTNPDQAMFLWSQHTGSNIHWLQFRKPADKLIVIKGKKNTSNYANLQPVTGKQQFGERTVAFPDKLVMLGPVMKAEYASMGPEGNFHKLGKENGPETIEALKLEMVLTSEKYSKEVCNNKFQNPLADAFFDQLEATLEYAVRTHFAEGRYNVFKDFVLAKLKADNETKKKAADKKKEPFEPELPPQNDAEWLDLLLGSYYSPIVKTDARGIRTIAVSVSLYDKLEKDASGRITGADVQYTPRDTRNGVFHAMYGKGVVNDKDQQRKEHVITYYRCLRPDEVERGGDLARAFPFEKVQMRARDGDLFAPLISFNFYDWSGKQQTGITRGIWDLVYVGRADELHDNPPTACNPLQCIPMATAYVPPADAQNDAAASAIVSAAVGQIDPSVFD